MLCNQNQRLPSYIGYRTVHCVVTLKHLLQLYSYFSDDEDISEQEKCSQQRSAFVREDDYNLSDPYNIFFPFQGTLTTSKMFSPYLSFIFFIFILSY